MLKGKSKKAFTLIELLVVISIIALLMAILIPVLNKGKELARSIQCKSILKGLFTAHYSYFLENNQLVPKTSGRYIGEDFDRDYDPWFTNNAFRANLKLKPVSEEYKNCRLSTALQPYKASYPLNKICPGAKYALKHPDEKLYPLDRSYGMNADTYNVKTTNAFRDLLNETGNWFFIADAMDYWFNYWQCDKYTEYGEIWDGYPNPKTNGSVAFRHVGKANMIYFDGHLERLTAKEVKSKLGEWRSRYIK